MGQEGVLVCISIENAEAAGSGWPITTTDGYTLLLNNIMCNKCYFIASIVAVYAHWPFSFCILVKSEYSRKYFQGA